MKKILCIALVIVFALVFTAGCANKTGGGGKANGKTTLTFWCHIDNVWNKEQDKIIKEFEDANPDITVQKQAFPYDDFESKIQTSLTTNNGADVYSLWGGWAVDFASTGAFAVVPNKFLTKIKADSYQPVLGSFEYKGKYYGVPLEFNNEYGGMLVSVPKFKELGLSYPTTWSEMISDAKKATKMNGNKYTVRGWDFPAWDALSYIWLSMILSSGGQYMNGDKFNFNTKIGIDTMQQLVNYVKVDKITNVDGITNAEEMEPYQKFYLGDALMVPRGPWVVPEGSAEYKLTYGKDFEYVSMPFYGPQKLFPSETGWGLAVNNKSTKKDAAWKFVEFWSQKDKLLDYDIACGLIPPYKSVATDPALVKAMPYLAPIIPILDGGRYIGRFNTDTLKENVCNMFVDIYDNNTPVATAVKNLDDTLNSK